MNLLLPEHYQSACEAVFELVRPNLEKAIPYACIEHVGSSAIKGAVSKGDLDIFVGVPSSRHERTVITLERLGYRIKKDTHRDDSLCMLERFTPDFALQVVSLGSKYDFFTSFRDKMNSDPRLVEQYNELKLRHRESGSVEYRQAKSEFIEYVLACE